MKLTPLSPLQIIINTDLSVLIHLIVGELDFLEGDDLLAKLLSCVRSIRVRIEPVGWRRVSLSGNQPRGPMVGIAVPLVVAGHDVQEDPVLHVRPQVGEAASDGGKHSSEKMKCKNMKVI